MTLGRFAVPVLWMSLALSAVAADTPPAPDFQAAAAGDAAPSAGAGIATVTLAVGGVDLLGTDGLRHAVATGAIVRSGESLRSTGAGRARIEFKTGDVVSVAPLTVVRLDDGPAGPLVTLWSGRGMAYALPSVGGRRDALQVSNGRGVLSMGAGKALVEVQTGGWSVLVYGGRGRWVSAGSTAQWVTAGKGIADRPELVADARFAIDAQERATRDTSPAAPAAQEGLKAYLAHDQEGARRWFDAVQKAYPFEPTSAYYLGLLAMERHENRAAARQFTTVTLANPEFAAQHDLPQHTTLLVAQAMGEEVKEAIANEQKLGPQPPEANSVAVQPFGNQGDPKYRALSKGLTSMVVSDLAKVPSLKVLERQKLQKLEDELKLSQSGLVDSDTAVRVGRLMKSEKMLLGDYLIGVRP